MQEECEPETDLLHICYGSQTVPVQCNWSRHVGKFFLLKSSSLLLDCTLTVLRPCLYEVSWPVSELARQQGSQGLYGKFDSESARASPAIGSHVPSFFRVGLKVFSGSFNFTKERMCTESWHQI